MDNNKDYILYNKMKSLVRIGEESLEQFFGIIRENKLKRGTDILRQGEHCNHIFFVEKGYLRTFHVKNGEEINTDFTFEDNFTTDLKSLRTGNPTDFTIRAGEDSIVLAIEKKALQDLYVGYPQLESAGRKLLEILLIEQEEHSNLFKIYKPLERYQYVLEKMPQLLQRISLSQLASYLGVTRETLSRIRQKI